MNKLSNEPSLALSYLELRKTMGILGIALPFVVSIGALILFKTGIQSSLSRYYHTGMGDVFVGTICVIGFFLLSYRGFERSDDIAGNLAFVFAVGLALFPTSPVGANSGELIIGYVHLVFAALFFSTLIYFSLCLFTKTDPNKTPTRKKLQRNKVYKACGYTMAICILLIAINSIPAIKSLLKAYNPVFWLQSIAIITFGISWFTKGEAILKDEV